MKYRVTIVETLAKAVEVEADTQDDAEDIVRQLYRKEEIILSGDDYVCTSYNVAPRVPFYKSPNRDFTLLQGDCVEMLSKFQFGFDMVFADPPYALPELGELPDRVMQSALLKEGGLFVLEHGKNYDFSNRPDFVEHRAYGSVNFSFFRK